MENTIDTTTQTANATEATVQPSLLRQIVDAADSLTDEQKQKVLWQIKMQKALKAAEDLDKMLENNTIRLTEDEIAELVSKDRRENYEKTLRT